MTLTAALAAALASLDTSNDAHWTNDGQARVDVVNAALARVDAESVTRQDIIDGAPLFTRETAAEFAAEYRAAVPAALDPLAQQERAQAPKAAPSAPPHPAGAPPAPPAAPLAPQRAQTPPLTESSLPPLGGHHGAPTTSQGKAAQAAREQVRPAQGKGEPVSALPASALDVPVGHLMRSRKLLEAAIGEIEERSQALLRERKAIDEELKQLYAKSELCARQLTRISPKVDEGQGVRDYLATSQRAREERARRARAFISSGTTAKDVVAELRGTSKLDEAMSRRKPAIGSTRPAARVPYGQQQG